MARTKKSDTSKTGIAETDVNMLTGDLMEALHQQGIEIPQEILDQKLREYAARTRQNGDQTPPRPEFKLYNIEPGTVIYLSDLVSLKDVFGVEGERCMRRLNKDWATTLKVQYQNGNTDIPEIVVVGSTWGIIVLDGYHRREGQELALKEEFLDKDGKLAADGKKAYEQKRTQWAVDYKPFHGRDGHAPNKEDVLLFAQFANLKNGLQVDTTGRSQIALWYRQEFYRTNGVLLSWRELAKTTLPDGSIGFGVSYVAIYTQYTRNVEKKFAEIIDLGHIPANVEMDDEERTIVKKAIKAAEEKRKSQRDPLDLQCEQLINAATFIYSQNLDQDELVNYMNDYIKDETTFDAVRQMADVLVQLEYIPDTSTEPATETVEA